MFHNMPSSAPDKAILGELPQSDDFEKKTVVFVLPFNNKNHEVKIKTAYLKQIPYFVFSCALENLTLKINITTKINPTSSKFFETLKTAV